MRTDEMMHFLRLTQPKLVICDLNIVEKVLQSLEITGLQTKIVVFGESPTFETIDKLLIGFESSTFV